MIRIKINLTTDGSGNATAYGDAAVGLLYAVQEVDGDLADGVDLTLTCEKDDISIPLLTHANFNTDGMIYPRVATKDIADGTTTMGDTFPLVYGCPKAVLAQGGSTATGAIVLYVLEM